MTSSSVSRMSRGGEVVPWVMADLTDWERLGGCERNWGDEVVALRFLFVGLGGGERNNQADRSRPGNVRSRGSTHGPSSGSSSAASLTTSRHTVVVAARATRDGISRPQEDSTPRLGRSATLQLISRGRCKLCAQGSTRPVHIAAPTSGTVSSLGAPGEVVVVSGRVEQRGGVGRQ